MNEEQNTAPVAPWPPKILPTKGRVVYFKGYDPEKDCTDDMTAHITGVVNETCVHLVVFGLDGLFFARDVCQGDEQGCWNWMPFQRGVARLAKENRSEVIGDQPVSEK